MIRTFFSFIAFLSAIALLLGGAYLGNYLVMAAGVLIVAAMLSGR